MARPADDVAAEARTIGVEPDPVWVEALSVQLMPQERLVDGLYLRHDQKPFGVGEVFSKAVKYVEKGDRSLLLYTTHRAIALTRTEKGWLGPGNVRDLQSVAWPDVGKVDVHCDVERHKWGARSAFGLNIQSRPTGSGRVQFAFSESVRTPAVLRLEKERFLKLAEFAQARAAEAAAATLGAPVQAPGPTKGGLTDELERLGALVREGLLTRDEFERAKAKLLA